MRHQSDQQLMRKHCMLLMQAIVAPVRAARPCYAHSELLNTSALEKTNLIHADHR